MSSTEEQIIEIVNEIGLEGVAEILRDIVHVRINNVKPATDGFNKMSPSDLKLYADYKVMLENCHEIIRLASKNQV